MVGAALGLGGGFCIVGVVGAAVVAVCVVDVVVVAALATKSRFFSVSVSGAVLMVGGLGGGRSWGRRSQSAVLSWSWRRLSSRCLLGSAVVVVAALVAGFRRGRGSCCGLSSTSVGPVSAWSRFQDPFWIDF